jgi:hypothetical protein
MASGMPKDTEAIRKYEIAGFCQVKMQVKMHFMSHHIWWHRRIRLALFSRVHCLLLGCNEFVALLAAGNVYKNNANKHLHGKTRRLPVSSEFVACIYAVRNLFGCRDFQLGKQVVDLGSAPCAGFAALWTRQPGIVQFGGLIPQCHLTHR